MNLMKNKVDKTRKFSYLCKSKETTAKISPFL